MNEEPRIEIKIFYATKLPINIISYMFSGFCETDLFTFYIVHLN